MLIKMQLKDIIKYSELIEQTGINPYCCNEGANPEDFIEIEVEDIILKEE